MNKEQKLLLYIINCSQFETSSSVVLDDVDLDDLYNEASHQSVLGIIAPMILEIQPDSKWEDAHYRQMASFIRYCHAEEELKELLYNNKVQFVVLKGNAAAISYKEPSYRTMGDIDIQVLPRDFERARDLLLAAGYSYSHEPREGSRHHCLVKAGVEVELHKRFSHDIDLEDVIVPGIENRVIGVVEGHSFPMLPPLANGLVLLDHMRTHLKSGLGLRQVVDWMMYVYRNLDNEFWESSFRSVAASKGLEVLAVTATRMCQIYLGLPLSFTWCSSADEKICKELMECLLVSGNFGRKNGSGNSVETVSTSIRREGLFRWLQIAGEHNWAAYRNHHWLKPFCWIYQAFRYAGQGLKAGRKGKELLGDLDRSKERYELLKKLGIS